MDIKFLLDNLTNPAFLFFILGLIAVKCKSDLEIPPNSSRFISLYLLFSIGFKGGQELAHSQFTAEILLCFAFSILLACVIPVYTFYLLRKRLGLENSGAIAAAYGSVSAVTFVTGISFLESQHLQSSGYMVAVMALMEAPAIIIGVALVQRYSNNKGGLDLREIARHSFTNGSVLLILGSLVIGFLASEQHAQGIKPFTTDIFKGFLAIFLLDMGITSGRRLGDFFQHGRLTLLFAFCAPILNGCLVAVASGLVTDNPGNRFMLSILAASASYIAVPAAMRIALPKANPGIFLPMALAVTFPFNITIGMPVYFMIVQVCG